jgi:DNA repair protein RadC
MALPVPLDERPRERCLRNGARCLSLRELLALILGSGPRDLGSMGLAEALLERAGPELGSAEQERAFFNAMELAPGSFFSELRGLGEASQARLLAAFELGQRYCAYRSPQKSPAKSPTKKDDAFGRVPDSLRFEATEWLGFVPLHRNGGLGEFCLVERGVRTHVNTDPTELFARVLALRPQGFFLFHNHPSCNLEPSLSDLDLTQRVENLARQLGIRLLGHGIVTGAGQRWIVI